VQPFPKFGRFILEGAMDGACFFCRFLVETCLVLFSFCFAKNKGLLRPLKFPGSIFEKLLHRKTFYFAYGVRNTAPVCIVFQNQSKGGLSMAKRISDR